MSFGGAGQGNIRYSIILDDTAAVQKIGQFKTALAGITQPSQTLATNIGTLNTNFATIGTGLTKTNTGFTQTGAASKVLATNLTGVNTGFTTLGTGINDLATPTRTLTTNMGALGNNFKLLGTTETQVVTETNAFKTGISALTTPTQTVGNNMKTLVGSVGPLAGNFQKATGAAKDMVVQENKLSTSSQSLGDKVKSNISRYSNLAIGLSTTVTSALSLGRSIRDLGDKQLGLDKATKKVSTSQEAYEKATAKVVKLQNEGKTGTVEYSNAVRDQSQALQGVKIATTAAEIKQKDFNDAILDTAVNTVPAILGTMGTLGSALNDAGVKGSLLNNTFAKLKGGAIGAGGAMKGIPGIIKGIGSAGIAAAGGLTGLVGLLGSIAALAAGFAIGGQIKQQTKELVNAQQSAHDATISTFRALGLQEGQLKTLSDVLSTVNEKLGQGKLEFHGVAAAIKEGVGPSKELSAAINKLGTDEAKLLSLQKERQTTGVKQQETELKITIDQDKAEIARLTTIDKTTSGLSKQASVWDTIKTSVTGATPVFKQLGQAFTLDWVQISKLQTITDSFGASLPTLVARFKELAAARKEIPNWLTPDMQLWNKWASDPNPSAVLHSNAISILDVKASMTGWDSVIRKNTVSAADNAKAIAEQTKKMEEFKASIAEGVKAVGVTFKVKDNVEKFMKQIKNALPSKIEKKIDAKLDFRGNVKDATTSFNNFLKTATTMDENTADGIVKGIIKVIDSKFKGSKGPFAGLRAQLEAEMKNPNTVAILKANLMNGDYTAVGTKVSTGIITGIKGAFSGLGLADWASFGGTGGLTVPVAVPVIPAPNTAAFDTGVATATTKVANISKTVPAISVNNTSAIKGVDVIAKRILSLTGLSPIISLVNKQAIKAVDVVAKRIDSLTGIKPQISLQNKQAIKSIDVVAKRIDSLEKIKPSISLQNKQAIKSVDVVAKRIQGLENIHPVINVKVNIPNIPKSAKGDTSIASKGDTSGIFVGGSKADSGGSGGDTIIENNFSINVLDETIMRRITSRSGKNRFTMGV